MSEGPAGTVSDLGEIELLARIRDRIGSPAAGETWSGDDTAILMWPENRLLMTTDMMVEGIDFDLAYTKGDDVGWKSLAINASDIASMGGRPTHAVAAVGLPPETPITFVDDFMTGILRAAETYGIAIVGGDVSAAPAIAVTISMVGSSPEEPIERSGARVGDAICVTGSLGGAAAGLIVLRRGSADDPRTAGLVERQLRPRPRVREAAELLPFQPMSMIDVSDGLAIDLAHVIAASGVGCEVDAKSIPIDTDISALPDIDPLELAVLGGEDFELLFTMPSERVDDAAAAVGVLETKLTRIGTVVESGAKLGDRSLEEWRARGWQHLRTP